MNGFLPVLSVTSCVSGESNFDVMISPLVSSFNSVLRTSLTFSSSFSVSSIVVFVVDVIVFSSCVSVLLLVVVRIVVLLVDVWMLVGIVSEFLFIISVD